ncbi:MAG: response regulator [Phycisphaerae bacterium]|nr:response regulator [Phycisphaerae bacterium]
MSAATLILIAEDSRVQSVVLQHLLERAGYQVTAAINGSEAISAARSKKPALVISDIEMPVMDGYQMCAALKKEAALADVPVMLLTGLSDPADVMRGVEAGADYYLIKPYNPEYLLTWVKSVLARPTAAPEAQPPIEVFSDSQRYSVTADRRQILNLLLSTYSNAVQRNTELIESQSQLKHANGELVEQAEQLRQSQQKLQQQNEKLEELARSEREAHEALKKAQVQIIQTEKLAGLGQTAAGVAHEINNPLSFVGNNMAVLQRDIKLIGQMLELYKNAEPSFESRAELIDPIRELDAEMDLKYTLNNLNDILTRSRDGVRRIQDIVAGLRDFARLDESDFGPADLNAGVESTVNIMLHKAKLKNVRIESRTEKLPPVTCHPAKINQVVMNLLSNAIDASHENGTITVRTFTEGPNAVIEVTDTGVGIDPSIRERIFDPFFTTKPIGQGTGLGLSISYGIVHEHGGKIDVESSPGAGARFRVTLPINPPGPAAT